MAQRMKVRGVAGCVVGGRVRDMAELKDSLLPVSASGRLFWTVITSRLTMMQIFALGKSTVGTNAEASVYARNIPISITGVAVSPVRTEAELSRLTYLGVLLTSRTGGHHLL